MHGNDFQIQFAAVMEVLVKSAVRETTELYETGVRELRIEMAQIKNENASLKERLMYSGIKLKYMTRALEDIQGRIMKDSPNKKCQPTEEEESCGGPLVLPDPPGLANDGEEEQREEEEEEDAARSDPAAMLKEGSTEVQFVLIKQEDSDTEQHVTETPPIQRKREVPAQPNWGREQDPLSNKGVPSWSGARRETSGEVSVPPSSWAAGLGPTATAQLGVGYPPRPSLLASRHGGNSCFTEFSPSDRESRQPGRAGENQQGAGDTAGRAEQDWAGHAQEGAGHGREGAGLAFSHNFLNGWNCPSDVLRMLPGNSRQEQQEASVFQCGDCGRVLSSAAALETHRSVHTVERPYPSAQCGTALPCRFGLAERQPLHPPERAHACGQCGQSFAFRSDLTAHARSHADPTPFRCSVCGKEFRHRRALAAHTQGHRGERRHRCPVCGKRFLDLGNFKRHKRIHTGEKPYGCSVCGRAFTQSAHLKKHLLTHK